MKGQGVRARIVGFDGSLKFGRYRYGASSPKKDNTQGPMTQHSLMILATFLYKRQAAHRVVLILQLNLPARPGRLSQRWQLAQEWYKDADHRVNRCGEGGYGQRAVVHLPGMLSTSRFILNRPAGHRILLMTFTHEGSLLSK